MNYNNSIGKEKLVSVLWVTRNRWRELKDSIESVLKQSHSPLELVVVDNASTDGTPALVKTHYPKVRLVCLHNNYGCPSARNIGFANCNGRYVYVLDDDGWIDPVAIESSLSVISKEENIGAVTSKVILIKEKFADHRVKNKESSEPSQVSIFLGGCTLFDRNKFIELGGFPDDFFRQAEEVDLSLRMLAKNYQIWYCPNSVMYHKPSMIERIDKDILFLGLRNTIRTSYRLIPSPYWVPKVILQYYHGLMYSWRLKNPLFLLKVFVNSILDARFLFNRTQALPGKVFRQFRELGHLSIPDWTSPGASKITSRNDK